MSATCCQRLCRNRNREREAYNNMPIATINAILIYVLFIRFSNSHYINTTNTYHSLRERYTTNVTTTHKHHQPYPPSIVLHFFSVYPSSFILSKTRRTSHMHINILSHIFFCTKHTTDTQTFSTLGRAGDNTQPPCFCCAMPLDPATCVHIHENWSPHIKLKSHIKSSDGPTHTHTHTTRDGLL